MIHIMVYIVLILMAWTVIKKSSEEKGKENE